jgi:hypothetical protein
LLLRVVIIYEEKRAKSDNSSFCPKQPSELGLFQNQSIEEGADLRRERMEIKEPLSTVGRNAN